MMVKDQQPSANGATWGPDNHYCFAEYSMSGVIANPSYQTCHFHTTGSAAAGAGDLVSCSLTVGTTDNVDNVVDAIYFNGLQLQASGDYADWTATKVVTFPDTSGVLAIAGNAYEEGGHGCENSGLTVYCSSTNTSSPWHHYRTDTVHWKAYGSEHVNILPVGWQQGTLGDTPCESGSGYSMTGYQHVAGDKIWPSNGAKYAWFSTNAYGEHACFYSVHPHHT